MKKLLFSVLALALLTGGVTFATESSVAGGFEASGHTFVGAGWQRYKTQGGPTAAGAPVPANSVAQTINGSTYGPLGNYSTALSRSNREDEFKFFLDEVELDLAKSYGENIRFRADLDFGAQSMNSGARFANGGGAGDDVGVLLEQAYATTNLALGNGVEFLLGRFNAPIGFESVDVGSNDTISRSTIYKALRPRTFTGAKIYYAFSDMVDWNFYVANNDLSHDVGDILGQNTDIPALGFRLGFNWGEEGKKSHLGWSGVWGQDHKDTPPTTGKSGWSFLGDTDWKWWVSDSFAFGGEAIYRQTDSTTGGVNGKYYGGLVNLHYDFSDVWDGTLKYAYTRDVNGTAEALSVLTGAAQSLTGNESQIHEMTLAGNYAIADGATLKLEGGYTLLKPAAGLDATRSQQHVFGVVGGFAYNF